MALAHAWKIALSPRDKLVLLALADHANDEDFTCWPSMRHLAKKTNLSVASVVRAIQSLEDQGIIARERGEATKVVRISNTYTMVYAKVLSQLAE